MPMYATRSRAAADRQLVILDPATYEFPNFNRSRRPAQNL